MLDDLILLRLLAAPGAAGSKVRADMMPLLATPAAEIGRRQFAEAVDRLVRAGRVLVSGIRKGRLQLTDEGQAQARGVFHIPRDAAPPKRRGWATWRDRYAMPHALGVKSLDSADDVRAALLRRLYLPELSAGMPASSLRATVDLLLAKRLGTAGGRATNFRSAALRAWLQGWPESGEHAPTPPSDTSTPPHPATHLPEDLAAFAEAVRAAAQHCMTGRFGDNKVFISHVWNALLAAERATPNEERAFKERLVRANTAGRLRLSRADLAGAHVASDVRASETPYLGEVFHFVRLD